jgi:hypothetical protein
MFATPVVSGNYVEISQLKYLFVNNLSLKVLHGNCTLPRLEST